MLLLIIFFTSSFSSFLVHFCIVPSHNPIVLVTFFIFIIKMLQTYLRFCHRIYRQWNVKHEDQREDHSRDSSHQPQHLRIQETQALDLLEIRLRIASSLGLKDIASCARVSQDWNNSFTPLLFNSVILSERGRGMLERSPSMKSVERNKHLIRHLTVKGCEYPDWINYFFWGSKKLYSTSTRDKIFLSVIPNSTLITLNLSNNWIGPNEAQALLEALKTNSTLNTLNLWSNSIRESGALALSEALRTNSSLVSLNMWNNSIGDNGAHVLLQVTEAALCIIEHRAP